MGFNGWAGEWAPEPWLHTAAAADRVIDFLRASADLVAWLETYASA